MPCIACLHFRFDEGFPTEVALWLGLERSVWPRFRGSGGPVYRLGDMNALWYLVYTRHFGDMLIYQ